MVKYEGEPSMGLGMALRKSVQDQSRRYSTKPTKRVIEIFITGKVQEIFLSDMV